MNLKLEGNTLSFESADEICKALRAAADKIENEKDDNGQVNLSIPMAPMLHPIAGAIIIAIIIASIEDAH